MEHRELLGQGSYFIRYCSGRYICQIPWHVQRRVKLNMNHSLYLTNCCCFSVTQSCLTLWPHGRQHTRLPCPSPTPGACSNSCPLSHWCHPTISSSVTPFSPCPQSFPASGFFSTMSWLFPAGSRSIEASASASILIMNIQGWFPLGLTGLISFRIGWFDFLAVQGTLKSLL